MIKRVFTTMLVFAIFILFCGMANEVSAASNDMQLTPDAEERRESFPERYSLDLLEEEPKVMPIRCFDVREDGCIVLGFYTAEEGTICAYSPEREFMYGYTFSCSGDFRVFWEQDYLCIFFIRSDVIAKLDRDGNCVALGYPVKSDTFYDLQEYFESPVKQLGDVTYCLENDWIIGSDFCRLKVTNADGSESVFYDASTAHVWSVMWLILMMGIGLVGLVCVIVREIKKEQKANS